MIVIQKIKYGTGTAHQVIGFDFNTHGFEYVHFSSDYGFGKTEFGNPVHHNSACFVKGLENRYIVSLTRRVGGNGKPGGP